MTIYRNTLSVVLIALMTQVCAYAGAESHGGQTVSCSGKDPVTLDYYQAALPTGTGNASELTDISAMSADEVLAFFAGRLSHSNLWLPYSRALQLLGPIETWVHGILHLVPDSDPAYVLPTGCTLQQAAVRQDSTVYADPTILSNLSPAQQGILRAHEALYYVAQQNGRATSVQVRTVIRNLLLKHNDEVALSKAVHELGSSFFWWENFANVNYYDLSNSGKLPLLSLSYDPMLNGKSLNYTIAINPTGTPSVVLPVEYGMLTCDDKIFGQCHFNGEHKCTISNFGWGADEQDLRFDLSCPDLGIALRLSSVRP